MLLLVTTVVCVSVVERCRAADAPDTPKPKETRKKKTVIEKETEPVNVSLPIAKTSARKLLVGTIAKADEGTVSVTRDGVTETFPKTTLTEETTLEYTMPTEEELSAAKGDFQAIAGEMSKMLRARGPKAFSAMQALAEKVPALHDRMHRRCAEADLYRRLRVDLLDSMAVATTGDHQYDKRGISLLTQALTIDPLKEYAIGTRHWMLFHVHERVTRYLPEDDPDPKIKSRILANQKKWTQTLEANRAKWQKDLDALAGVAPAQRAREAKALLARITAFGKSEALWTSRAILKVEQSPHTYAGECEFHLADELAR